jgi:hypothetical protein
LRRNLLLEYTVINAGRKAALAGNETRYIPAMSFDAARAYGIQSAILAASHVQNRRFLC